MSIKHRFVSPVTDLGDPNELGPDEWNDSHSQKCGVGTFVAGVCAIDFTTAGFDDEDDVDYVVQVTPHADEVVRCDYPVLTTGFTARSSNGGSTSTFFWTIARA